MKERRGKKKEKRKKKENVENTRPLDRVHRSRLRTVIFFFFNFFSVSFFFRTYFVSLKLV